MSVVQTNIDSQISRRKNEILEEINRVESERQKLLMKDYLTVEERRRLAQIRDEILPVLWDRRRHEQDSFYDTHPYDMAVLEEDNATASAVVDFNRDNRRGPRLPSGRSRKNNAA
jgi:hypothetical protein